MWKLGCLFSLIVLAFSTTVTARFKEACYPYVGCFNNNPPFNNSKGVIPESPEKMGGKFELFSRENRRYANWLKYSDITTIKNSNFKPERPTTFVIHGFASSIAGTPWILKMKDALLDKADLNVICVGWGGGASFPAYDNAAANLRLVATEVKLILDMMETLGLNLKDVHLIGHSLGAHMSGYIGLLMGSRIGRISGLDPAEPNFEDLPTLVRLDKGDADFVDVLHTDGHKFNLLDGGYGLYSQSGHVDFYVNGGLKQPGCSDGINGLFNLKDLLNKLGRRGIGTKLSCSHHRAPELFIETISSACPFTAYPCRDYETFQKGECLDCGTEGCSSAGYYANNYYASGKKFLNTFASAPYCGHHFHVKLLIHDSAPHTSGALYLSLVGRAGETDFINVTETDKTINSTTKVDKVVLFRKDVGVVEVVNVKYVKSSQRSSTVKSTFTVSGVEIKSGETGRTYGSCIDSYILNDKVPAKITTHLERPAEKCDDQGSRTGVVVG